MALCEVAAQDAAAPSWQFLQRCWARLQEGGGQRGAAHSAADGGQEGALLLWVISHAASRFPASDAEALAEGLLKATLELNMPCAALAAHIAALHRLTQSQGGGGAVGAPRQWCGRVAEGCQAVLAKLVEARGQAVS